MAAIGQELVGFVEFVAVGNADEDVATGLLLTFELFALLAEEDEEEVEAAAEDDEAEADDEDAAAAGIFCCKGSIILPVGLLGSAMRLAPFRRERRT